MGVRESSSGGKVRTFTSAFMSSKQSRSPAWGGAKGAGVGGDLVRGEGEKGRRSRTLKQQERTITV